MDTREEKRGKARCIWTDDIHIAMKEIFQKVVHIATNTNGDVKLTEIMESPCVYHTHAHALSPHYFLFVNTIYINQLKNKNICLYILRRYVMVVRVRVLNVSLILLHTRYIVGFKSKHNVT